MNPCTFKLLLAATLLAPCLAHGQTLFTYQGMMAHNGSPFNGTVDLRLSLYSSPTNFNLIQDAQLPGVNVVNGHFTATTPDFTPAHFPGAARYLKIEVSQNGGLYTELTPRQQIAWVPYAMTAASAATATSVSGTVAGSQITGSISPGVIGGGTIDQAITFSPSLFGAPFSVLSSGKVTNLNSDLLDGHNATDFLERTGGTMTGPISFGASKDQHLALYSDVSNTYGIGVQDFTQYFRTGDRFAWYQDGTHVNGAEDPGSSGLRLAVLSSAGLHLRKGFANSGAQLAIGDSNSPSGLPFVYLREPLGEDDVMELSAKKVRITTQTPAEAPASLTFGATTGQHVVLFENATDTYGLGVQAGTHYFRTGERFAWYKDGVHSETANSPGAGGSVLASLSGSGQLIANGEIWSNGPASGLTVTNRDSLGKRWTVYSRNSGGADEVAIWNNTTGDVAAFSPAGNLYLVGSLSTTVLTIRGGADVAEPFEMTEPDTMEPGSVVVIDEENPGRLKLSCEACDTRVAGIISGAGGVKPGLRLHQEGVLEGDHHVALSGRVYVKADASLAPIKPGDLLTTSDLPGHAMKVRDHAKAQGAILGKAMSKLEDGAGLVLVLVTLQ